MDFKDKNTVITGAEGGIGLSLVKHLDSKGANLFLIGKDQVALDKIGNEYQNVRMTIAGDFTNIKVPALIAQQIANKTDQIDILVNCAGIGIYKDILDITEEDWVSSLHVNVTAPLMLMQGLLPLLKKSSEPKILNIGSNAGVEPLVGRAPYVASKFALRGMSLVASFELREYMDVSLITLGSVMTNFGILDVEEKKQLEEEGKAYFLPQELAEKLCDILSEEDMEDEYVLYP